MRASRLPSVGLLYLLLVCACGKELPELNGIDKEAWIRDKKGCLNDRAGMMQALEREKEKLLALDEMQIVAVLGKPDENELYKRNQKFYYYNVTPAIECAKGDTITRRLSIRFNAVGLANEIQIK